MVRPAPLVRRPTQRFRAPSAGFTLVEVLVVIAVIAMLAALLLPVLGRARESAKQVKCLSNVRQLAAALISYTNDNRGWFPGAAMGSQRLAHDWIHWQTSGNPPRDPQESAIARHLSKPLSDGVFTCPSDQPEQRTKNWYFPNDGPYRYSYTVNSFLVGNPFIARPGIKVGGVRHSSEIIMVVEESEKTINDGLWVPERHDPDFDFIAIRHDRFTKQRNPTAQTLGNDQSLENPRRRGNVAFVDGHADYTTREYAHDVRHYHPKF
jgi:prepilin-type N-terminal cleavage/methylation domain-containing protein/prepilin-type processing-associated H-X9-DG protein